MNKIPRSLASIVVAVAAFSLSPGEAHAQSAQVVTDLYRTIGRDLAANPAADGTMPPRLFVALDTPDFVNDAVCVLDPTQPQGDSNPSALVGSLGLVNKLTYDPASDSLYSVGGDPSVYNSPTGWIVRRSLDQGQSWTTLDAGWRLGSGAPSRATGFARDLAGNLLVGGWAYDKYATPNRQFWIIRRSSNQGATWSTLKFGKGGIDTCAAVHFTSAQPGSPFAVGRIEGKWTVMRSRDAGLSWQTVDSWGTKSGDAVAIAITSDSSGRLFVGGQGRPKSGDHARWYVRVSSNGGDTWQDLGLPFLSLSLDHAVNALALDHANNLWIMGNQAWNLANQQGVALRWNLQTGWAAAPLFPYATTASKSLVAGATTDPVSGNVYATGGYVDPAGFWHGTVLELGN